MNIDDNFIRRWAILEDRLTQQFGKMPSMEAILFLVGINEYKGRIPKIKFSKEQKQDLMHVAICTLLSKDGYYAYNGHDEEGWPHYLELKTVEHDNLQKQEELLKSLLLDYFEIE
jgi:hypothetical protein